MKPQQPSAKAVFRQSFSLVEMCLVLGIIGLLAVMLMTAISKMRDASNKQKARIGVQSIAAAFRAEQNRIGAFGNWGGGWVYMMDQNRVGCTASTCYKPWNSNELLYDVFAGILNSYMTILSIEISNFPDAVWGGSPNFRTNKVYIDPWGKPYRFILDHDADGMVPNPFVSNGHLKLVIAVWSGGPDGVYDQNGENSPKNKDNVKSW